MFIRKYILSHRLEKLQEFINDNNYKKIKNEIGHETVTLQGDQHYLKELIVDKLFTAVKTSDSKTLKKWQDCLGKHFSIMLNEKDTNGDSLLHWAGFNGNLTISTILLEAKADPLAKGYENHNYYDYLGQSLVYYINKSNDDLYKKLLAVKEINLEIEFKNQTAFSLISEKLIQSVKDNKQTNFLKWQNLLGDRFNTLIQKNINNNSLMEAAAVEGNIDVFNLLIEAKADPNTFAYNQRSHIDNLSLSIIKHVKENQFDKIKKILLIPNINLDIKQNNTSPSQVIFERMFRSIDDLSQLKKWQDCLGERFMEFINKEQFIEKINIKKEPMLLWAGYEGLIETIDFLLEAKANPEIKGYQNLSYIDNLSISVFKLASRKDFKAIRSILKNPDVNININFKSRDVSRCPANIIYTTLVTAIKENNLAEVTKWHECLENRFAEFVNKKDKENNTLLHLAGLVGNIDIADILLEHKANPMEVNDKGLTYAKCLADATINAIKDSDYTKLKRILSIKDVDWDYINMRGETTLEALKNKCTIIFEHQRYHDYMQLNAIFSSHIKNIIQEQKVSPDIEKQLLSSHLIQLITQHKFKEVADILLDDKTIDLSIPNDKGISPLKTLTTLVKKSVVNNNEEEFMLLKSSIREDYFKNLINLRDEEGNTLLMTAIYAKNKILQRLLKEAGANSEDDFVARFQQLPKEAFMAATITRPAKEIKIYDKPTISTYKKNKSNTEFQNQFNTLLQKFNQWGSEHKCLNEKEQDGLQAIERNFFSTDYSGMQTNQYFENIKNNLEQIYKYLHDNSINLQKRTQQFCTLCTNFAMCSPGLSGHVSSVLINLQSSVSLAQWLAEMRTSIIHVAADLYNKKHNITDNISIHTYLELQKEASAHNWNPLINTKELKDPFATLVNLANNEEGEKNREEFRLYFMKEYTPETIRECIQTNLDMELIALCKTFGYQYLEYNPMDDNSIFQQFTTRLKSLMEQLGVKIPLGDYIVHDEDYTSFKIQAKPLLDELCKTVILPALYYMPSQKIYQELIPISWTTQESKDEKNFSFNIWKDVAKDDLTKTFIQLFPRISCIHHKNILLQALFDMQLLTPIYKEISMLKNNGVASTQLRKIDIFLHNFISKKSLHPSKTNLFSQAPIDIVSNQTSLNTNKPRFNGL